MKQIILLLVLILLICACRNTHTEYLDSSSNNEKKYFDYLNSYKEIDSLSEEDSKRIFKSFKPQPEMKSYTLKNGKKIYYVENNNKQDLGNVCYNSDCNKDDICNIAAVSTDHKYCFYLNKEPTEHKNPNVNIEPQWKTMDFSNYPHYFTAGQF